MTNFFEELKYEVNNKKISIAGSSSHSLVVEIPSEIHGYEVNEIGDYAFSNQTGKSKMEEIILPKTIKRIGRYAFYNCRNLKRLQFYNTLKDIGAGAFTACHKINEIDVTFVNDQKSCLRELLTEIPEEQTLFYHSDAGEARLVFPEYFEEAVENTPARILETHTHGSGMMYRNCFVQQELQFQLYDNRFEWAKGREYQDTLFRLVFGRLLYPYQLGKKFETKYIEFLKQNFNACAKWAVQGRRQKESVFLAEYCADCIEELELLIEEANKTNAVEIISYLMEFKHQKFQVRRKNFEL